MGNPVFRTKCMCGCGDGIEIELEGGRLKASFFRDDAGAKAGLMKERADYVAGKNLLREIMMERGTFEELLGFLESAELTGVGKGGANKSHLAPTHLLDDIYAVWLQGTLPFKAAFGKEFRNMFRLELTAMDRDVLVVQMRGWLAREKVHSIPEGVSPHVDRLAGTQSVRKVPTKAEAMGIASEALKSVQAAAKAAVDAVRHTSDPEGAAMEDELYGESGKKPGSGLAGRIRKAAGAVRPVKDGIPDTDEEDAGEDPSGVSEDAEPSRSVTEFMAGEPDSDDVGFGDSGFPGTDAEDSGGMPVEDPDEVPDTGDVVVVDGNQSDAVPDGDGMRRAFPEE